MRDELLIVLARCRVVDKSDVVEKFKLSETDLQSLLDEKLVQKATEQYKGEEIDVLYLTDKGEAYVKAKLKQVKEIYRGFKVDQDLALYDFYMRRNDKEKESWITRDDLIKKHQLPGTVDGAFISEDGRLEAVKTLSPKSGYDALKKVEEFIKKADIPYVHYLVY